MGQLKEEKLKKTLWFAPIADHYATYSRYNVINQILQDKVGLVKDIRVKLGKKIPGKTNAKSIYMFVEFEQEENVERASRMVYKGRLNFSKKAYLCGTQTYALIRRSKKK